VAPKKGRALFWTSVMSDAPCERDMRISRQSLALCQSHAVVLAPSAFGRYERDDRTDHEALAVEGGVKYAANYWLHMFPFRQPSTHGCGNSAYADNWF